MKNLLITAGVIAAIGLVGYVMSQRVEDPSMADIPMEAMEVEQTDDGMTAETNDEMDLSGIHIMADGSVMLGDGTTVSDATVNADGMIVLGDGRVVEPMMDMRQ